MAELVSQLRCQDLGYHQEPHGTRRSVEYFQGGESVADSPVNGAGKTLEMVFASGQRYQLDYYQRDYSWGRDEVRRLIVDLNHRFADNYKYSHARTRVADYQPYFLGSYVYHEEGGITYVVDGQQRITTLHLLLMYLRGLLTDADFIHDADNLIRLIHTRNLGETTYTIDIPERKEILDRLFQNEEIQPSGLSADLQRLWDAGNTIETEFPAERRDESLPYFVDWLLQRVCVVGIKAADRKQGWEIYEGVNDRGVRLGPLDLLKSLILREVAGETSGMDAQWRRVMSDLAAVKSGAPVDFVRAFLIGRYSRDSGDIDKIEDNFYTWFRDNAHAIGLVGESNYRDLLTAMEHYATRFCTLQRAADSYDSGGDLRHVYYNGFNRIDGQFATIIAAVRLSDDEHIFKTKTMLVAQYLDLGFVWSFVGDFPVDNAGLTGIGLIVDLRATSTVDEVKAILAVHVSRLSYPFTTMGTFGLKASNSRQVRYMLARLTSFVAVGCGKRDECAHYLDSKSPWEIEHVWADKFDRHQSDVKTRQEFDAWRNRFGALLLLSKSDNASYRDASFADKVNWYARQNDLAASLHPDHRTRNPRFNRFIRSVNLDKEFRGFKRFDRNAIRIRQELCRKLCERVWSPLLFGVKETDFPQKNDKTTSRTRARYDVGIADLIKLNRLRPNEKLIGHRRTQSYLAYLTGDGIVKMPTGETFGSLSAAGQFVLGTKSCQGWEFWRVARDGKELPLSHIRREALESGGLE